MQTECRPHRSRRTGNLTSTRSKASNRLPIPLPLDPREFISNLATTGTRRGTVLVVLPTEGDTAGAARGEVPRPRVDGRSVFGPGDWREQLRPRYAERKGRRVAGDPRRARERLVTGVLGEPTAVCVRSSRPPSRRDPPSCGRPVRRVPKPLPSQGGLGFGRRPGRSRSGLAFWHITAGPREDRRYGGMDADLRGEPVQRGEWQLIPAAPARSRTTAC